MIKPILLIWSFLLTLTGANAQSGGQDQFSFEPKVEPQPYLQPQLFGYIVPSPIKQVIVLSSRAENGNRVDTSFIYYYDQQGKRYKEKKFDRKDKDGSSVFYFEYSDRKIAQWQTVDHPNTNPRKDIVIHEFNKENNIVRLKHFWIKPKSDTIYRSFMNYAYNKDGQLASRNDSAERRITRLTTYQYKNGNLVSIKTYPQPERKGNFREVAYSYSPNNLLIERTERQVDGTVDVSYSLDSHSYHYNNLKQLVKESYSGASYQGKETIVEYTYNEQNKLATMKLTRDSLYRNAAYSYENGKLVLINVETNAWNAFHTEMYIPLSSHLSPMTPVPFNYQVRYRYDEKGNVTERVDLLNGQAKSTTSFLIEYY